VRLELSLFLLWSSVVTPLVVHPVALLSKWDVCSKHPFGSNAHYIIEIYHLVSKK